MKIFTKFAIILAVAAAMSACGGTGASFSGSGSIGPVSLETDINVGGDGVVTVDAGGCVLFLCI